MRLLADKLATVMRAVAKTGSQGPVTVALSVEHGPACATRHVGMGNCDCDPDVSFMHQDAKHTAHADGTLTVTA